MRDVYYNLYFRRLSFFSVVGNGPTLVWLLELVVVVVVEVVVAEVHPEEWASSRLRSTVV